MQGHRKLMTICAAAVLTLGLAACGGGGSDTSEGPPMPPPPTPYESAVAAIAAATTAADAQAAYDAVKDDVTASEGDRLQMAVDARAAVLATMARAAMQRAALMTAAGMIDTDDLSTQDLVDAARTAIAGLRQAIADAVDVDDTSMYQTMLTNAVDAVDMAQGGINTATRRMNQMTALSDASDTLQAALAALSGVTPTQAQLDAANTARTALNDAITAGADLTDTEKAPYQREADNAAMPIQTAQQAFEDAEDDAEDDAARAMRIVASKLRLGISRPTATDADTADTDSATGTRFAGYVTIADTPTGAAVGDIVVGISDSADVALSEDKTAMVADNHGWQGKRYTRTMPASDGTYEAVVYSNVGEPTQGDKFGQIGVGTPATGYVYGLSAAGVATVNTSTTAAYVNLVGGSNFDQSAGVKRFPLPSPNTGLSTVVSVPGTFHGVSGTYTCTPGAAVCAANVSGRGFQLGTVPSATDATFTDGEGAWMFKPSNPEARVMDAADMSYASYGWWLHKTANDLTWTASAFVAERGTDSPAATGLDNLNGTATYMGGAAGKYAISSLTGGTNDAGHFTARATLTADFTNNTDADAISGTIDQFIGADGESRNWTVELMPSTIGDTGEIGDGTDGTRWIVDGLRLRNPVGQWSGSLRENGADGVPEVATGTWYTWYANTGRMVGAFGANKQ